LATHGAGDVVLVGSEGSLATHGRRAGAD